MLLTNLPNNRKTEAITLWIETACTKKNSYKFIIQNLSERKKRTQIAGRADEEIVRGKADHEESTVHLWSFSASLAVADLVLFTSRRHCSGSPLREPLLLGLSLSLCILFISSHRPLSHPLLLSVFSFSLLSSKLPLIQLRFQILNSNFKTRFQIELVTRSREICQTPCFVDILGIFYCKGCNSDHIHMQNMKNSKTHYTSDESTLQLGSMCATHQNFVLPHLPNRCGCDKSAFCSSERLLKCIYIDWLCCFVFFC